MKKPITIIIVMIILTMIIGFERIGLGLWFLISDNRTERARSSEASAKEGNENSQVDSLPRLREDGQTHSPARHSESPHTAPEQASQSAFVPGGAPVAIDVTGDLSSMHYIRSSEITGTSEISAKEIERLRRSVDIIGEGLDPSPLIFDADAPSTSEAPFILYARDGFDLTDEVKVIYERLLADEESSPKTANVEQGVGGQPATAPRVGD